MGKGNDQKWDLTGTGYVHTAHVLGTAHHALIPRMGTRKVLIANGKHPKKAISIESLPQEELREAFLALNDHYPPSEGEKATQDTNYDRIL